MAWYPGGVPTYPIRHFGDPVLKQRAKDVTDVDGTLARFVDTMFDTMYEAEGGGLAAPQVGIGRRFFVYKTDDGPQVRSTRRSSSRRVRSSGPRAASRSPASTSRSCARRSSRCGRSTSTATRWSSRPTTPRPGVPARDRPPRRHPHDRPARPRRAQEGAAAIRDQELSLAVDGAPARPPRLIARRLVRVVYLGTPAAAVPPLRALHAAGHDIALVVTQPDRKRGRGGALGPEPGEGRGGGARAAGRDARARRARSSTQVRATGAELGVVVAFGQLLPGRAARRAPARLRERALLAAAALARRGAGRAGDPRRRHRDRRVRHGVEAGLDTGPVFASRATPIDPDETAGELHARLVELGTDLLLRTLPDVPTIEPAPQDGRADVRREADRRGVRARPGRARRGARAARARRQPAAGRVDRRRREAAEGVARPRRRRTGSSPTRCSRRASGRCRTPRGGRPPRRRPVRVTARGRRRARSRSTRWSGSRTARSRTSCCPACSASTGWSSATGRR